MSNETPFWKETPADGEPKPDHAPAGFSKESPIKPGGISAVDPDTGEWKPVNKLETYEIGGHTINLLEGPMAAAQIHDTEGNHIGTVNVPFDPAMGEPSDADLEAAVGVYHTLEYLRGIVRQDAIDAMVSDLFKYRADGARPLTDLMIEHVSEVISEHVSITVTDDDGDLTPDQLEALQLEVNRLFAETLPKFIRELAQIPIEEKGGLNFWQQMAQDTIAHALMYARNDAIEEYGGPEAVEALDDDTAAEWEARTYDLYKTGPYLSGALMQGWRSWLPVLGEISREGINYIAETPATDPDSMAADILKRARENLGMPPIEFTGSTPMPQLHGDPLPQNQAGRIQLTSLGMHQELTKAIARLESWEIKVPGGNPEHRLQGRNTDGHLYIEGGSAMRLWQELQGKSVKARTRAHSEILPDVLIAVLAIGSARRGQLDLFGNGTAYMPIDWLAKTVGITGKRKPSDIDKLYTGLRIIGDIQMTGRRIAWIGGKKTEIPFIGPMWQIMETVPKVNTREEYEQFLQDGPQIVPKGEYSTPIPPLDIAGVSLAIGAGLIATVDENPQFAQVVAKLTDYSPVHGRYKRWLGFVLSWIFRDRKKQQSWGQAFTVRWLLEESGLPVDEKPVNPQRPFNLFQEALETLQADGVIGEYSYPDEKGGAFKRGGRGWYPRWLDSRLVILPPDDVHAAYLESNRKALARSRKRQNKKAG